MTQSSAAVAQGDTLRISDHNTLVSDVAAILASKGAASGIATLDASSKLVQTPADGAITTAMLAAGAVTQTVSASIARSNNSSINTRSTSSTSFVNISGISVSITTSGGDLLVFMTIGPVQIPGSGSSGELAFNIDGTDYIVGTCTGTSASSFTMHVLLRLSGLAAGTYTVQPRMRLLGTTSNIFYAMRADNASCYGWAQLDVMEMKR